MSQATKQRPGMHTPVHDKMTADRQNENHVIPPIVVPPTVVPFGAKQGRTEEREREICRSAIYGIVSFDPVRPPRKNEITPAQAALRHGRPRIIVEQPVQPTTSEAAFFERACEHLNRKELAPDKPPGSRRHTPHTEFLKCLHLYGSGILSKEELILLLRGLFLQGHAPKSGANAGGGASNPAIATAAGELLKEFEELLIHRGPYAEQERVVKDKSKYGALTTREYDLSQSKLITPSYRTYPPDYPFKDFFTHSGRTEEDAQVLNDKIISIGNERSSPSKKQRLLHSPEDYDGVRIRRNAYEDAMAKIEDERFEVDMAVERNASACRLVEPYAEEVTKLREDEEKDGQPIGRLHYKLRPRSLHSNHIGAIARIYGDRGDEVIHHLVRNPIAVLPIVMKRLREKDTEWKKVRTEMTKHWKSVAEANYEGSLDTLCYFYRREIERSCNYDVLLETCKRARHFVKHPRKQSRHPATEPICPVFSPYHTDRKYLLFQPHLSLKASNTMPHKDAFECLSVQFMKGAPKANSDREKIFRVWAEFIVPWFDLPVHWFLNELRDRSRSHKSSCIVKYVVGQKVRSAFGDGTIISSTEGNTTSAFRYKLKLPYGIGYVRSSSIVHALSSDDDTKFVRRGGFMEVLKTKDDGLDRKLKIEQGLQCRLAFGTEKVYLFLRLYCALITLLNTARDHLDSTAPSLAKDNVRFWRPESDDKMSIDEDEPESQKQKEDCFGYRGLISSLQEVDLDFKSFEVRCRRISKDKVFIFAALPRLLEKCADALVKVSREDMILPLFDISQCNTVDPLLQRKQSLDVSSDASYRIQYHHLEGLIHFAYLPKEVDFPTSPRSNMTTTTSETPSLKVSGDNIGSKVLSWRGNHGNEGPPKRLKLK